jgi:hypothetical protein
MMLAKEWKKMTFQEFKVQLEKELTKMMGNHLEAQKKMEQYKEEIAEEYKTNPKLNPKGIAQVVFMNML